MSEIHSDKDATNQETVHAENAPAYDSKAQDIHDVDGLERPEWRLDIKIVLTFLAMMVQYNASFFSFTLVAPITSYINQDLGPVTYNAWMAIIWPLAFAATMAINGRLGDIFGRRYLMIGGNVLGVVASIIGGTAKSIAVVILAIGLNGIAGAIQQTASACCSELVPRRYRPQAASTVAGSGIVGGAFGIPIAIHIATKLSWRWGFWISLLTSGIGAVGLFFFYFPPTFADVRRMEHRSRWETLRTFDFLGVLLFVGGITVLLVGINWGGSNYPWKSAGVIVPIIIGALSLVAFGFWEVYGKASNPIVPYRLFKNVRGFTMVLVAEFVGGMLLYSLASLWPLQVEVVYQSDSSLAAWESCTVLLATFVGVILIGNTLGRIGHARIIFIAAVALNTLFIGCMAAMNPSTNGGAIALTTLTGFTIGFIQLIGIVMIMLNCPDEDIGVAVGLNGTARTAGGSIATAIYSTILTNKISQVLPVNVAAAVLPLGLPATSLAPLILALLSGSAEAIAAVPGVTLTILGAAGGAVKESYSEGFRLVYLVAIAFGVVATICAAFTRDIDHLLTNDVAAQLYSIGLPGERHIPDNVNSKVAAQDGSEKC